MTDDAGRGTADVVVGDAGTVARHAGADATDRQIVRVAGLLAVLPPLLLVLDVLPFVPAGIWMESLDEFLLLALLGVALNVAFGHTDQLFLFVGGLTGISAYTAWLVADASGATAWLALPLVAVLCGAIGALVSWVSAKRRFTVILIAILTLTLQLAMEEFFVGADSITNGQNGRRFLPGLHLDVVGDVVGVSRSVVLYYLLLVLLVGVLAFYVRLVDSKYGLAFAAIREDEVAAASVGIDVVRYKTAAGFMAATLVGVVGVMRAQQLEFIYPQNFRFLEVDVIVLIVLVLGGLRTTFGPVVGAAIVVVVEELLNELPGSVTDWQSAIFGALLVVLFLYFRSGVVPAVREHRGTAGEASTPGGTDVGTGPRAGSEDEVGGREP